jgi:pyruvate/2-oxoglutarate/acetoin dehydrogenase E1 component
MSTHNASSEVSFRDAIRDALAEEMRRDARVVLIGEDVGPAGGAFKETAGLFEEFGPTRVWDAPISEQAIIGAALGAAITGIRPVVNLMFADFALVAFDGIANQLAKYRFMSGGQFAVPVVIRAACGGGLSFAAQHSQTLEGAIIGMPGLRLVTPSTPADAKGLLRAAIRDDNPVIFLEHKALYNRIKTPVPDDLKVIPLGSARTARPGRDVTVVATMAMVYQAIEAAENLAADGIELEVIDLRSLAPLDSGAILRSLARTNRLVIVEEAPRSGGWGATVAALVQEEAFDSLDAPVTRVCLDDVPLPYSPTLEARAIPDAARIEGAVRRLLG